MRRPAWKAMKILFLAGFLGEVGLLAQSAPAPAAVREFLYEDRMVAGYRFQGSALPETGPGAAAARFLRYRILKPTAQGSVCVREISSEQLARAQGQPGDACRDRSRGLFLVAFNPARQEAYLATVVDAARTVTREIFAIPLLGKAIRSRGSFTTAGEGLTDIQLSPTGEYLSFLALWGNQVLQGLTVIRLDTGTVQGWPSDPEARSLRDRFPAWALEITDYQWQSDGCVSFHQKLAPNPEPPIGSEAHPLPERRDQRVEKWVDPGTGKVLREIWQKVPRRE